jgi:SPOR domain
MSWFYEALSRAEEKRAESARESEFSKQRRIRAHVMAIVLALAVTCVAFLIGYYWRGTRAIVGTPREAVAQPASPTAAMFGAWNPPPPARQPPAPAKYSLAVAGFVLQVAATQKEANADALAAALRQQSFSAFVFRLGTDRLYRVAVGPFPQRRQVDEMQHQLEAQGFKSFVRPWRRE